MATILQEEVKRLATAHRLSPDRGSNRLNAACLSRPWDARWKNSISADPLTRGTDYTLAESSGNGL
jgi:hypothetical protein